MDRARLLKLWGETFQTPPPPKLRKELMVPILAYRMQEVEFGGLSNTVRKRLQELIATNRTKQFGVSVPTKESLDCSKLIRSWKGEVHEVILRDDGYIYRGETYRTLSPIARRITGTQWSGPAFFGTKAQDRNS